MDTPAVIDVFTARLTNLLTKKGWTRQQLASAAEMPLPTINSWYRKPKVRPTIENAARAARAIGCSLDYLVGHSDHPSPIGELLPDGAVVADTEMLEDVLSTSPSRDLVEKWINWDPPLLRGLIEMPSKVRVISYEEGRRLAHVLTSKISGEYPKLYRRWYSLFGKAIEESWRSRMP